MDALRTIRAVHDLFRGFEQRDGRIADKVENNVIQVDGNLVCGRRKLIHSNQTHPFHGVATRTQALLCLYHRCIGKRLHEWLSGHGLREPYRRVELQRRQHPDRFYSNCMDLRDRTDVGCLGQHDTFRSISRGMRARSQWSTATAPAKHAWQGILTAQHPDVGGPAYDTATKPKPRAARDSRLTVGATPAASSGGHNAAVSGHSPRSRQACNSHSPAASSSSSAVRSKVCLSSANTYITG